MAQECLESAESERDHVLEELQTAKKELEAAGSRFSGTASPAGDNKAKLELAALASSLEEVKKERDRAVADAATNRKLHEELASQSEGASERDWLKAQLELAQAALAQAEADAESAKAAARAQQQAAEECNAETEQLKDRCKTYAVDLEQLRSQLAAALVARDACVHESNSEQHVSSGLGDAEQYEKLQQQVVALREEVAKEQRAAASSIEEMKLEIERLQAERICLLSI